MALVRSILIFATTIPSISASVSHSVALPDNEDVLVSTQRKINSVIDKASADFSNTFGRYLSDNIPRILNQRTSSKEELSKRNSNSELNESKWHKKKSICTAECNYSF